MGSKPGRDAKLPDTERIKRRLQATAYNIVVRLFGPRLTPKVVAGVAAAVILLGFAAEIWSKINSSEGFLAAVGHSIKSEYLELAVRNNAAKVRANPTAGSIFRDHLYSPEMVVVPAGSFLMGESSSEDGSFDSERPPHQVMIGYVFAVGKFPVTRGEFARFASDTNLRSDKWQQPGFPQTDSDPVVDVSWDEAKAYVKWLTNKTGHTYRLLSESEYEYAERAGSTAAYWWGDTTDDLCKNADSRNACGYNGTLPVGTLRPNAFGLYDMAGNVWSWTEDCWHKSYAGKPPPDGSAWTTGDCDQHVERGGSWNTADYESAFRSAIRDKASHGVLWYAVGFRVATTI